MRLSVSGLIPCYLQRYFQTFSCGFGAVEKECNDSATCSKKYYSSFWPFEKVWGFGMVVFGFLWDWLILWKKMEIKKSEEETLEWKIMFSEIFAVLETGVSSPPHILLFGAALFSCIDLFWRYFGHIRQAGKINKRSQNQVLSWGICPLECFSFQLSIFQNYVHPSVGSIIQGIDIVGREMFLSPHFKNQSLTQKSAV